jgi:hypothetical protein
LCEAALALNAVPWPEGSKFTVDGDEIEIDQEMLNCVSMYATITGNLSDVSLWRCVERRVELDWLWNGAASPESVFGTLDFGATDGVALYIVDFKYGRGKHVRVERNTQLLCYALGVLGLLDRERPDLAATLADVCLVIVQPRAGGEPVRQWTITVENLLYWGYAVLKPSIETIVHDPSPGLTPGSHCWFCAASHECQVYRRHRIQRSIDAFPDWVEPDEEGIQ